MRIVTLFSLDIAGKTKVFAENYDNTYRNN